MLDLLSLTTYPSRREGLGVVDTVEGWIYSSDRVTVDATPFSFIMPTDPSFNVIKAGEYDEIEFEKIVKDYRERWCRNKLAILPAIRDLKHIGNLRIEYTKGKVILHELATKQ